jgi:hypothetical protein
LPKDERLQWRFAKFVGAPAMGPDALRSPWLDGRQTSHFDVWSVMRGKIMEMLLSDEENSPTFHMKHDIPFR